ncbi:hypothetical protein [Nitrosopumilus zosterae]|uniref:hypothetical protein n=1 Tax=Nitrosopumilus zosterae TaxID=718286 RepID=UPI000D6EC42A|nr:hypothetical protein [Nitrosopumilus zosterae]BDQ31445.1 hypothetical protein NZOSNM25_001564 [Nitrosopumilus zosterae]
MKTRYKVSIIIATSTIIYILFHGGITHPCMLLYDDGPNCFMFWFQDTSIHITTSDWDTGNGIGSWSGTGEIYHPTVYDNLKDNSGFIFWHMILPVFVVLLIYQRDRIRK